MSVGPRVSVIVPFLDAERFLAEAVDSVLGQTYQNWELVLVDDGSTDGGAQIARGYAAAHPNRIRCVAHAGRENRGMSSSRNLGIQETAGELIAFLDADDVWTERKLEQQVEILANHPQAAMVVGATEWWYSWTGEPEDARRDFVPPFLFQPDRLLAPPEPLLELLRAETAMTTPGLVRRSVVERAGGFENPFRGLYEDQVFFAKVSLERPVYVASACWYRWRRHPAACCIAALDTGTYAAARRRFLEWLAGYIAEVAPSGERLQEAVVVELERLERVYGREGDGKTQAPRASLRRRAVRRVIPASVRRRIARRVGEVVANAGAQHVEVGAVQLGTLARTAPISRSWGYDRGTPIDRYYLERFLAAQAADIRGRVLEVGDDAYTRRFGSERVTSSDILDLRAENPRATVVADLADAPFLPSASYDCIVITQTLQFVYDLHGGLATLHRLLAPGGVVLASLPAISHTGDAKDGASWCWTFTPLSARRLFEDVFAPSHVLVHAHGNVLAAVAFLHGLATEEVPQRALDERDSDYAVLITVRAAREAR